MITKLKVLVVDTAAFVKNVPLWEHAEELVSVDEVLGEIKDAQSRQYVAAYPVTVNFKQPQPESIHFINEFTKKTGDYHSLSLTDVKLLALTYELEVLTNGSDHLRKQPMQRITNTQITVPLFQVNENDKTIKTISANEICSANDAEINELMEQDATNQADKVDKIDGSQAQIEEDEGWNIIKRKKKINVNQSINSETVDDTLSVTSSVRRSRGPWVRDMLPGFYMPPDEEEELSETCHGLTLMSVLEDHLTTYSYVAGYEPFLHLELVVVKLVVGIIPSCSHINISNCNQFTSSTNFLENGNFILLKRFMNSLQHNKSNANLHYLDMKSCYPSILRWLLHLQSFGEDIREREGHPPCTVGIRLLQVLNETLQLNIDCSDSDEEGWLTPENIGQYTQNGKSNMCGRRYFDQEEDDQRIPTVACMTADFAMQNVLKHVGLDVLGVDGKLIREARNYVLRCFTCYRVTPDMSKLFCPRCGNRTLKRVSMTINPDGTQQIWISRRPLNLRGMKFNLPKPRGGQHAVMPLLTADQRFPQQWAKRSKNTGTLNPDYVAGSSPFNTHDVYSRAAQHGYHSGQPRGINGQLKHAKIWKPKHGRKVKK